MAPNYQTRTVPTGAPFLFFENLGKKEGITSSIVKMYQDKDGVLWFPLEAGQGLMRFDGARFTQLQHRPEDKSSIPSNTVMAVLEDRSRRRWLATDLGVFRYDPAQNRYKSIPFNGKTVFFSLFEDRKGRVWAGTESKGMTLYDPVRDSMIAFSGKGITDGYTGVFNPKNSLGGFTHWAEAADGLLWAIGGIEAAVFTAMTMPISIAADKQEIHYYPTKNILPAILNGKTMYWNFDQALYHDTMANCLWMGGYQTELVQFSLKTKQYKFYNISPNPSLSDGVLAIYPKNEHQLWIGTRRGLCIFDVVKQEVYPIEHRADAAYSIQAGGCIGIMKDRDGSFWFLFKNGLSRLAPGRQQFAPQVGLIPDFETEAMTTLPATGELLLTRYSENGVFEAMAGRLGGTWRQSRQFISGLSFESHDVTRLCVSTDNRIWVGLNAGVGWLDPKTLRLHAPKKPLLRNPEGTRTDQLWVSDLRQGTGGDVWMTTWNAGLVQYEARTGDFICHSFQLGGTGKQLFNIATRSLCRDAKGRYIIGSMGTGLEIWDPANNSYQHFEYDPAKPDRLTGRFVFSLCADKKGRIWVGTEGGLCRFFPDAPPEQAFERAAVPPLWIEQIVADTLQRLWLQTEAGLILFDPAANRSHVFGEKQGMTLPFQKNRPIYCDPDGKIWYGNQLCFDPVSTVPQKLSARPMLTGLRVHDQARPFEASLQTKPLDLDYADNTLRFDLTALDFDARPGESLFKVKLDFTPYSLFSTATEADWIDLGTQNFATFANLAPGAYRLHYLAGNGESGWMPESEAKIFLFNIHPHWSDTWWFRALLAALILGFVATATAFYYRYQLRAQQLQAEKQQREAERQRLELEKNAAVAEEQRKVAESEMKLLRSQLNPHFLFNAMNSINRYILSNEKDKASEYLGQFAQLTRSILDNSRSLTIPLADELKMLHHYLALENHRFQQNIHWTFTVSPDLDEEDVLVPSMFLQPFAENAILHGLAPKGGGHIAVEISQHDGGLQCVLRDDGVGRQPAAAPADGKPRHASVGMRLIAERLHAFAGLQGQSAAFVLHDLKDGAGLPLGTEVVIRLPLVMAV